jgi:hypothetical protein
MLILFECQFQYDWRYDPKGGYVPEEVADPTKVSEDDIINAIVSMPVAPAGFPAGALDGIPFILCPLGENDWGCPGTPTNINPGDGTSGDMP